MVKIYKAISLFSNAGIGDVGVENAGVHVVFANELLSKRCRTYKHNHKDTIVECKDINELKESDYKHIKNNLIKDELFLLVATPPCQGVSRAGKMDKYDIRNQLIKPTVFAIKQLKPLWVWMENVSDYAKATIPYSTEIVEDNESYERINLLEYIERELAPYGYKMEHRILDAKDYGVPQSRKRLIVILTRTDKKITFPEKTHGEGLLPYRTVRDAISFLEPLESGEKSLKDSYHFAKQHNENHVKWMKATPEGCTALDNDKFEDKPHTVDKFTGELRPIKAYKTTYKRMWWDKPAPTVTMCSGSISSQNNVHPRDSRAMTPREAMLFQTIPMDYTFPMDISENEMREMIGEAIPSLLAEVITKHIIKLHQGQAV